MIEEFDPDDDAVQSEVAERLVRYAAQLRAEAQEADEERRDQQAVAPREAGPWSPV